MRIACDQTLFIVLLFPVDDGLLGTINLSDGKEVHSCVGAVFCFIILKKTFLPFNFFFFAIYLLAA